MRTLGIDLETYSSVDLSKTGQYKYTESDDFDILLFAYSLDGEEPKIIDLTKDELPVWVIEALFNKDVLKTAYNAKFEISCLEKYLGYELPVEQWEDTMLRAAYCGYPLSLENCAKAMEFEEDKGKDKNGKALIKKFCQPRKPTKNDNRTRILPEDEPEKWELFKEYCLQDVRVETAIRERLKDYPLPATEQAGWELDLKMQKDGVLVDTDMVNNALSLDANEKARLKDAIQAITGISNPKSAVQMKSWLTHEFGHNVKSLTKDSVPKLIKEAEDAGLDDVVRVLTMRQELEKTSLAKYSKIDEMLCSDNRIRGFLQYYGTRTGRWSGRGVQLQNLPRNYLPSIECARELLIENNLDGLSTIYGANLSDIASQLIRTVFIPKKGKTFAVADYSAIEARVIAWLSREHWRLDVFKNKGGKIYEASAAQMFGVDFEKICDKDAPEHSLRAQGKVAELALGYQGGAGALASMDYAGAIPEEDRPRIVKQWREKSPNIVEFWYACERAAKEAIKQPSIGGCHLDVKVNKRIAFRCENDKLIITLPSGRELFYNEPRIELDDFGREKISYMGQNQTTKKYERTFIYGGKIVENIVQAVARDCLAESLLRLKAKGYDVKFHVHDEVIIEVDTDKADEELEKIISIMCEIPDWAEGLPLNAAGFVSPFYMKD